MPSWSRCWPRKAWSWSTDAIQTPVGLIHIHLMHNWGPRPKVILSEAGDVTKSMVMWLLLTRIHDHSGADLGEIMQWICHIVLHKLILCIIWIWMRPTGVSMVSLDQDHAFRGHHLLQVGIKRGYLTVISRVPCARVLCCAARLDGTDCSIIDPFSSNNSREVFLGF